MAGKRKGKTTSEATKAKTRATIAANGGRAGARNPMFGKKRPDVSAWWHEWWKEPGNRESVIARMKNGGGAKARAAQGGTKSSIEQTVESWLIEESIDFMPQKLLGNHCVDFFIEPNIIIECDGDYWHSLPKQIERDEEQTELYARLGYTIIRWTGSEIREEAPNCQRKLRAVLAHS